MTLEDQINWVQKQMWMSKLLGTEDEVESFKAVLESLNRLKDLEK
jgi:hypothetical protein